MFTRPPSTLLACAVAAAMAGLTSVAAAQPASGTGQFFRCTSPEGAIQFSDKPCLYGWASEPVQPPADPSQPSRRAQNDASVRGQKASGDRLESDRLSQEAAARADQDRQVQAARQIANRLQAERDARNAATTSVLPATSCDQCRSPSIDAGWPAYIR